MINKVILVGRLGKDPEIRSTPGGQTVAKFSVATDERFTDKSGEKQERTEWHNVVCWARLAEICGQYLRKGMLVYIEGSIRTLTRAMWEEMAIAALAVFLILWHFRSAFVICVTLPLSVLFSFLTMWVLRVLHVSYGGGYGARKPAAAGAGAPAEDEDEVPF